MSYGPSAAPAIDDPPLRSSSELSQDEHDDDDQLPVVPVEPQSPISPTTQTSQSGTWQERVKAKRKTTFESFFDTLDSLIYAELFALYCCDNSTLLLIFRALSQGSLLQAHKTPSILFPRPLRSVNKKQNILAILLVNVISILVHALSEPPRAGELTHCYLQGHVIVDFIGQRALNGWKGRARLVGIDLVVMWLQVVAAGWLVQAEKKTGVVVLRQGHGIWTGIRDAPTTERADDTEEGLELRPLMSDGGSLGTEAVEAASEQDEQREQADEGEEDLEPFEVSARFDLEALYSGQVMLADIRIWTMMRDQYYERRNEVLAGTV